MSALTLDVLDVRAKGVEAVIYTSGVGAGMQRLMQEHDRLFPAPEELLTSESGGRRAMTAGWSLTTDCITAGTR